MALHLSLALVLLVTVAAMVWKGRQSWFFGLLAVLAGFYLARTAVAPVIDHTTASLANLIGGIHL